MRDIVRQFFLMPGGSLLKMTKRDLIICEKGNVWCLWCVVTICISIAWPWHTEFPNKVLFLETLHYS